MRDMVVHSLCVNGRVNGDPLLLSSMASLLSMNDTFLFSTCAWRESIKSQCVQVLCFCLSGLMSFISGWVQQGGDIVLSSRHDM